MVSIKDVARQAGVSVTTVSLVLNNKGAISDSTRQRVMDAVNALNYTRSVRARNLRDQESRIIGYAQAQQHIWFNPLLDSFLHQLTQAIEATGRHVLLFNVDPDNLVPTYRELIDSARVDGFVLSFTQKNDPRFSYLLDNDVPFVAFGRSGTDADAESGWVDVDGEHGAYIAAEHLIEQGYRKLGFIGWPEGSFAGDARYAGFCRALDAHGMTLNPAWVMRTQNTYANGYALGEQVLAMPARPEAVVAVSDLLALGILQRFVAARQFIAVTGFDDIPSAGYVHPTLTSVHQPIDTVAALLTKMLVAQLEGEFAPTSHLLKPSLIIRESSTQDYTPL